MGRLKSWWTNFKPEVFVLRIKKFFVDVFWHPNLYQVLAYSLCIAFVLTYFRGWNWLIPPASIALYFLYQEIVGDAHTWAKLRVEKK